MYFNLEIKGLFCVLLGVDVIVERVERKMFSLKCKNYVVYGNSVRKCEDLAYLLITEK